MNIRKLRNIGGCAALVVAGLGLTHHASAQIAVTGSYDPAFGSPLSYAYNPTSAWNEANLAGGPGSGNTAGFSDSTQIDASYATIRANQQGQPTLYMFFAGNMSSGLFYEGPSEGSSSLGDWLNIFIQTGTGGVNSLANADPNFGSQDKWNHINGSKIGTNANPVVFDSSFAPNYRFSLQQTGGTPQLAIGAPGDTKLSDFNLAASFGNMNANTNEISEGNTNPQGSLGEPHNSSGGSGGGSAQGINFTIDNSNTMGITGTTVPSQAALAAITTGVEVQIPLYNLIEPGQSLTTGSPIKISYLTMQGNNNPNPYNDDLENQVTNLGPNYIDYTGLASPNSNTNIANGTLGGDAVSVANSGNSDNQNNQPVGQAGLHHYFTINNVANLTWNNAGATGDGITWDAASQNFNDGANPAVYTDGSLVTFNDSNNGHYNVTLNSVVNPGSVTINSANSYTFSGTGGISGVGAVQIISTAQDQNGSGTAGTVTFSTVNTYTGGTYVGSGTLVVNAAGALPANSKLTIGQTGIESGQTVFATAAVVQLAPNTGGETLSSLTVNAPSPTEGLLTSSQLDITNNHIFINYGTGADPIKNIETMLQNGYNGGAWNGTTPILTTTVGLQNANNVGSIISSTAAANSLSYSIGYADSADPGNPAGLAAGQIEVKYTLLGDANLDGAVNSIDFAILATNFNKAVVGSSGWDQGDFNYDGSINSIDFADLAGNFNKGASQADVAALEAFASENGLLLANVPEPVSTGVLALGALGALSSRRRNSKV